MGSLFGAEYVWTGRGDGSTWTDKDNWGGSGYPGESDNATFSSGAEVTITSDITVNQIYLNASSKVTCDSNVTISLNSIITQGEFLNKGTLQKRENVSFIIKVEAGGKLINENKIICTDIEGLGNSNITNNGTIEASGAATFQSGANFTNADTSELSIGGAMTNVGTFSNSGGTVTVKGTTTNTGTIINTGDFTSEGAITNNNGGKITNNSSGTISGNINNSGGTVTNNGGTISDEVSGGTFEDNPIVVYSTIDSPDTVLDWNDASSWENGVKPDISGRDTAAIITLNGDVNISDFQDFFAAGNKNITLNGTGNLLYNGKKIYISQKSDTELNWNTTENWINGVVPIITGEGNQEVVIVLNSNFISSETLVFNNATGAAIHIYLCNKKLSANSVQLVSGWTHPDNNPAGNIHFYGPGTVETKILDASNNTNRTSTHRISLYDETIFKITEHAYADPARGEIIDTTGDCEVYLPASGFDMRVPSGKNDGATFVVVGTQAKAIEPQSYYKIELTSDISDTEKIFTFSRSETGKHNYDLNFPYVVYLMGDASWKLGDTELSDGFEGNVTIPSDNIESGTSQIEKTILLSSGTVESGDGIKVIFYTPCKNLVLNEFIYEKEIIYWTGDVSEDFSTPENWTFEDNPLTNLGDLTGKVVKIPSNCTNYPKLSSDISLEKLVVEDRAEVTIIDNGKLTVEKIHIYDSGALKAESGTVVFSGENPSYFAKYPEFSKFGTIEVASGTFNLNYPLSLTQLNIASGAIFSTSNELDISSIENSGDFSTTADLHITKSLTNNGTFQAEKVYLEPSENNITITGNSGDTEEFANNTKITELYCENQAEKNLVINNGISVEKIALSGIENASGKRLTVKYDKDNYSSGFIYLENNYDEAKYLFLADNSLVTIKNATITVYESDTQNIPASNFVEKGWRLGDPSEFIWIGKTDDWNDPTNWDYGTVPTPGKPVKIPTGLTNYPVLDTDINLIDETADIKEDSLIIEIGAEINFAGNNFSVTKFENFGKVEFKGGSISSTSINNSGTVILTGKEEISGEISESGTVIYSGTESDAKFSWGSNYKNLEIQDGFTGSFENGVIVSDSLKIENGFEITEKLDNSKNLLEISGTGTLSNKENISITSTGSQSFNGKINLSKILNITSDDKLTIATQSDFTNAGNILAVGVEVNATGVFTNEGKIDSSNADIRIESARFTNGAEKEIFSKNMSIDSGAVTNAGILTTTGDLVVNATGDFTSQGKVEVGSELNIKSQNCIVENEVSAGTILLEVSTFESTGNLSSTGELSITATLITNSGKIEAQNGEMETTEANILFGENSENTFTGKLVVTTATDFENKGTIIASEFEVNATTDFENKGTIEVTSGNFSANVKNNFANNSQITVTTGKLLVNPVINFTNAGNILAVGFEVNATGIFTNDGTITSTSGDVNIKSASFINGAEKEIFAKNMSIDSSAVTNAGILTATGDLLITATSITNSGKIEAQNGELETTEANILFGENSENTFTGKLVVTTATDFENNGIIIASEFEVNATTDFENKGTIEVTSGDFSANVNNNFANNSQITVTTGKLLVNLVVNFTNAGNILAVGFEVTATGVFTNEGTIDSKDISINSPTVNLAGTINAETNISISGNLYIIGESSISFGENFFVGTDENPKDIYISALDSNNEAANVKVIPKSEVAKIQIYGNFALFNGDVSLGTELVVGKDMILLNGKTSGENSIYKDSMTGFDLFKYHLDDRPVSCNLEAFPTEIPNNNIKISHEEYKSTFMVENGKTILVWNNFYNNGVDLGTNTTDPWSLKIPANDVATSSFAECYNAKITNCEVAANTSPGSAWLSTENCTDGTGNTNVAFSKAIFANVATISDNIIRVSFVDGNSPLDEKSEIKIENSCNEISSWMETDNFRFNISSELPEGVAFSGIFANPECTETTDGKGDLSTFYLKYDGSIDYRWNTDATGSDPGAEESTDYSRNHKNVVPNLLFKRAIEASYAGLRDEHKNRLVSVGTNTAGAEPLFEATKDEAPPVLVAVTLGQEQHETEAIDQHHYDSHNFIEWQFSEPVEFENYPENGISQIDGVDTSAESENIQSTTNFGKITNNGNGFSVAGFGSFETGKVSLGSKTGSGEVNAFYRKFALEAGEEAIAQKNRIRLSIAGYVDEKNPVVVNGVNYKNWLGFIDSKNTIIPSGTFTMSEEYSKSIKDLAGNEGISPKDSIITNAIYSSMGQDLQTETLYGTWDIDPPVVANYMKETSSEIYAQELLAVNNTGGNTAESLEIHFLDNSAYNTLEEKNNLQWRTKIGWKENNVQINQTIPLDTKGGSRMTSDYNKTLGGLRFSTIIDSLDAFVCQNIITKEYIDLIESEAGFSQTTTNKNIFGECEENQFDVPYLTLKFEDAKGSLLKHNYELKYNTESQEKGFITDLAGNLLYDFTVNSPDKNPPQFLLSIGGVNYDKLYILFSKPIDYLNQNNEPDEGKLRRIVKSLSVFESTPDGEKDTGLIDYKLGSKAKVVTKTKESTGIEISLTRKVSYDELKNLYIGVNTFDSTTTDEDADSSLGDPITGEPGEYSMLYDMFENPISEDSKHCFSDFAVNAFDVLYAYDGRAVEEAALARGVFGGNQWTVTDFSGETNNSSKIIAGKDITIAGKIVDSSENPDEQDKFSMLADISPAKNKAGLDFEDYTDRKTRLWFPDFVKLFPVNNSSTSENFTTDNLVDNGKIETDIDGKDNNIFTYVIPNNKDDSQSVNWADGDEFEFLFKIYNSDNEVIMVDGNVDGDTDDEVDHPLFALRLKDENDITSIDLWSLHIVDFVRQKGGTTILNNVINSLNNEETVVEVQVPQTGFLTVQVLTLDGNVVKVLQRGRVEEGTYYYKWNGTNISGAAVARGMYFVRVVGPNIDETRKVMVIKE